MHERKFLHESYLRMTRTKYVKKNDVIENVLCSSASDEAVNRAPPEIAPSTKSCTTLFVHRYRELDRALTGYSATPRV